MIKQIEVKAKEWTDKTYGNSYFSAEVSVIATDRIVHFQIPMTYGYDSAFEYTAAAVIAQLFDIKIDTPLNWWARNNNIIVYSNIQKRCLKRELIPYPKGKDQRGEYQYLKGNSTPFKITHDEKL